MGNGNGVKYARVERTHRYVSPALCFCINGKIWQLPSRHPFTALADKQVPIEHDPHDKSWLKVHAGNKQYLLQGNNVVEVSDSGSKDRVEPARTVNFNKDQGLQLFAMLIHDVIDNKSEKAIELLRSVRMTLGGRVVDFNWDILLAKVLREKQDCEERITAMVEEHISSAFGKAK